MVAEHQVSPLFWNRYVDDTFTMFHNKDSANEFLHYLNGCHHNIKFTIEFERNDAILFLDILVTRNQNNAFMTSIYRKVSRRNGIPSLHESTKQTSFAPLLIATTVFVHLAPCYNLPSMIFENSFRTVTHKA